MNLIAPAVWFAMLVACGQALAQGAASYPGKPIRIVVPSPAGGPLDVSTRVIGQKMAQSWGQQVLAENRPGANNIIGTQAVAKAAPDGYTLLMAIDSTLTMHQSLYSKLPYDPIKDFVPVTLVAWSPLILVTDAAIGPKSVKELIREARANPGKLSFGAGTLTTRLGGELLKSLAGIDMVNVPYKGSAGTVQGLLSRDVTFIIDGVTTSVPHIKSGKFRVLAGMSSRPISALPNLPSLAAEAGLPGFDVVVWLGLVAPAGTPAEIVDKLQREVARILRSPEVREKFASIGLDAAESTPSEFAAFIRSESDRWSKVIKQANFRVE